MTHKKTPPAKPPAYDARAAISEGLRYASDRYSVDFRGAPLSVILEIATAAAGFHAGQARPMADAKAMDGIIDETMELIGRVASRPALLRALSEVKTAESRKALIKKLLAD